MSGPPWLAAGTAFLYTLRLALALPSTAAGLRRWLLLKTPLPAATAPAVAPAPERKAIGGRRGRALKFRERDIEVWLERQRVDGVV